MQTLRSLASARSKRFRCAADELAVGSALTNVDHHIAENESCGFNASANKLVRQTDQDVACSMCDSSVEMPLLRKTSVDCGVVPEITEGNSSDSCSKLPSALSMPKSGDLDDDSSIKVASVAKPTPEKVSVAVQTDAYDSDDDYTDDDDDSCSSSSFDSESETGDEVDRNDDLRPVARIGPVSIAVTDSESSDAGDVENCDMDANGVTSAAVSPARSEFDDCEDKESSEDHSAPVIEEDQDQIGDISDSVCPETSGQSHSPVYAAVDESSVSDTSSDDADSDPDEDNSASSSPCLRQDQLEAPLNEGVEEDLDEPTAMSSDSRHCQSSSDKSSGSPCVSIQQHENHISPLSTTVDHVSLNRLDSSLAFKTPEHSPVESRFGPGSVPQQFGGSMMVGGYGTSPSMYGIGTLEGSPATCVTANAANCLTTSGTVLPGYGSLPTPSPTNSSSRSFNMASPGTAYQQPGSAGCFQQLEQSPPVTQSTRPTPVSRQTP